ncbi:MAG: VOC family protein [Spirulina sp. SIO3F2]|nr:VOC family protein [Spirulina sp. SIO3F2]
MDKRASRQSTTPRKTGLHLKRPCLLVADLERSLQLYRDVLGFRLDYVSAAGADSYLYQVFQLPATAELTFAALSTEHELRALALTEVKNIPWPPVTAPHRLGLVMQVPAVEPLIEQVRQLDLEVVEPNCFNAPPNLVFTEQGFYDFDGQLVIIYETRIEKKSSFQS